MGRMILVEQGASLVGRGTCALHMACAREKGACAGASGVVGSSTVQVNVAPEGAAFVVTFDPLEKVGDTAADGLLGTSLSAQVDVGREEGRSQDSEEGSLRWASGLVVHWGVLGRTGAHHWSLKAEKGPSHLGG